MSSDDVGADGIVQAKGSQNHKLFAIDVNGATVDIAVFNYSDRLLIIVTQFGKLGSLVSVRRSTPAVGEVREDLYDVRTLFGDDRLDYHVTARALAESVSVGKPILFGLALRDVTFPTVQTIRRALLENKIW